MFGFFQKKKNTIPTQLLSILKEADSSYMTAYVTKNTRVLSKYMTDDCRSKVAKRIYGTSNVYFGTEKFRETSWVLLTTIGETMHIQKDVHFEPIKIGSKLAVSVANDFREVWVVDKVKGNYVVKDIMGGMNYDLRSKST